MESLLAIQVHRCFLRKSQKSMLVVFPRENAAVLSYTTATMTRGTSNSNNNKNNNFGTFSTKSPPSSASMASRTTNAQCVIYMRIVWPGLTQGVDTSMVILVIEFSKEGYKIKNNLS